MAERSLSNDFHIERIVKKQTIVQIICTASIQIFDPALLTSNAYSLSIY